MTERLLPSDAARQSLIDWYVSEHRQLPWRATRDPYRILVSEIMLQQTQADRVATRYHEFLARFPTLEALADAPASEVIRAWAGLGYNRRALNLQRACRAVIERHNGVMPSDPLELATLPGIGPYTAGAVACFAFERDVAFVDTNIRRVIHRVVAGPELPEPSLTERETADIARALVPPGQGYLWNQALMELGATICRARMTFCERCPLAAECRARPVIQAVLAATPRKRPGTSERFETTSRYARGRIIDALRAASDGLSFTGLAGTIPDAVEPSSLRTQLAALIRDGLVVAAPRDSHALRENAPAYDAGASDDAVIYRLPE
jgi:A/G-specific adenine glycosylase